MMTRVVPAILAVVTLCTFAYVEWTETSAASVAFANPLEAAKVTMSSWSKDASGNMLVLDSLTIANAGARPFKDFKLVCELAGAGGDVSSKVARSFAVVIPAGSRRTFTQVNMGFMIDEPKHVQCGINELVPL